MTKLGDAPGWDKMGGASGPSRCQKCGKPVKDPKYKLCYECNQKQREGGSSELKQEIFLPQECIFSTFYDEKKYLRREIYIEGAEKAAEAFTKAGITTTSIRNLFYPLKEMANNLKTNKTLEFGFAKDAFFKVHRQIVYNINRKGDKGPVLHPVFKEFVDKHLEIVTNKKEEFLGFVEYLTSIVARLKQDKRKGAET